MSNVVYFRGKPTCKCVARTLPMIEKVLIIRGVIKKSLDIAQLTGAATASGGTHKGGGAFDLWQHDDVTIYVCRQAGADATWERTRAQGFPFHAHGVLRNCPHNLPARYQITAVDKGYNGLGKAGMGGRDDGPRPLSHRSWEMGIAWCRAEIRQHKVDNLRRAINRTKPSPLRHTRRLRVRRLERLIAVDRRIAG